MYNYSEVYSQLNFSAAVVTFYKQNGELRTMLCSRDLSTITAFCGGGNHGLGGHDKRCNKANGNVAVVDLIIGEARSFNIERVLNIEYIETDIKTEQDIDNAVKRYQCLRDTYAKVMDIENVFDDKDNGADSVGQAESNTFTGANTDTSTVENTSEGISTPNIDVNAFFA